MIEYFRAFLEKTHKKNGMKLSESTIDVYVSVLDRHRFLFEFIHDSELLIEHMNTVQIKQNNIILYATFRYVLAFLGIDIYDDVGVHKKLKKPRVVAVPIKNVQLLQNKILSKRDLGYFLDNQHDPFWQLVYHMLYDTACRRAELCHIKFKDIKRMSPETDAYYINQNIYAHITITGKGGKKRLVAITKKTFFLLVKVHGTKWHRHHYVFTFTKQNGELYKDQTHRIYMHLQKSSKELLDRQINPHSFRHTKLTHLACSGMPLPLLRIYAGHESIQVTEIYLHVADEDAIKEIGNYNMELTRT